MQTNKRFSLVFTGGFCCVFQSNWYDCNSVFPQISQPLTEDSCSTPAWVCWRSRPVKSRLFIPSIRRCCSQIPGSFLLNFVCFIYFTIVEVYFFLTSPILLISQLKKSPRLPCVPLSSFPLILLLWGLSSPQASNCNSHFTKGRPPLSINSFLHTETRQSL